MWFLHSTSAATSLGSTRCPVYYNALPVSPTLRHFESSSTMRHSLFFSLGLLVCVFEFACAANTAVDLHSSVGSGKCKICIERNFSAAGAIDMNFKDNTGESNWNLERFDGGLHRDCTQEKISNSRMIKMVQFFPWGEAPNCICSIQLACHDKIGMVEGSFVDLSSDFLTKHWQKTFPEEKPSRCPNGTIPLSNEGGFVGMNILRLAFSCYANDTECLHRNVEMWK